MALPTGFKLAVRSNGEVVISHHGTVATVLRGRAAARLVERIDVADDVTAQHLMARATGNYQRGNERPPRP